MDIALECRHRQSVCTVTSQLDVEPSAAQQQIGLIKLKARITRQTSSDVLLAEEVVSHFRRNAASSFVQSLMWSTF